MSRITDLDLSSDLKIKECLDPDKVKVIILDGPQNVIAICEAVEHGKTTIETVNGVSKKITFNEDELIIKRMGANGKRRS